jgi:Zn-dependent peptidase ImmA (M78 family)
LNDNVMEAAKETEVKVAARMAGALPADAIVEVIRAVLTCRSVNAQVLDEWSETVMARLNTNDTAYPYEQGVTAADAMREILGIEDCARVDPFALFDQAGVVCHEMDLYPDIDAVACWGPSHGPAVVINPSAKRLKNRTAVMRNSAQARVTAAHELCHLLLDRNHMVSTVEVLGGRTPIAIEQRARAFAPAFLLPKSQARKAWDEEGQPTDQAALDRLLRSLCRRFGVTRIVASWKIEHGIGNDAKAPIVRATLDQMLPNRMGSGV